MATKLTFIIMLAGFLTGCAPSPPTKIDWRAFDSRRAFNHVRTLVEMGPRPSGSLALAKAASYIAAQLEESGLQVSEQVFISATPRGPVQFRNIIARAPRSAGGTGKVLIVASHYDTKYFTNTTFVGANDGGSSAGTLLEIARCAASQRDIWFVFFDGEEAVHEYTDEDGLTGSRFFVEQLKGEQQLDWIKGMILLDMIGDARLNVTIPLNSTRSLIDQAFDAARDVGTRDSFALGLPTLLDDHVPFLRAGIPAIDFIDFEYGSAPGLNDYWHTEQDTLDKLNPRSLEIVGQTTLRLLAKLRAVPPAIK